MISHDQVFSYNNICVYIYIYIYIHIYRVIKITMTKIKFERIADIYRCALRGDWSEMEAIVRNNPDSVRFTVAETGDTALHVAAGAGNTSFVEELTKLMKPEDQLIPNFQGMLPVHLAALSDHHRVVQHFCSQQHLLKKMDSDILDKLFYMTIGNDMFGKLSFSFIR